jgi:hypothetical protein
MGHWRAGGSFGTVDRRWSVIDFWLLLQWSLLRKDELPVLGEEIAIAFSRTYCATSSVPDRQRVLAGIDRWAKRWCVEKRRA